MLPGGPGGRCNACLALPSTSFPGRNLAPRHSELTCDQIDPLDEACRLGWNLREEGVQADEPRGFDQTFLVAHPLAALADNCVGLLHDCRCRLPGRPREVAPPRMHARVVEAKRPAEAPPQRRGVDELGRKRRPRDNTVER